MSPIRREVVEIVEDEAGEPLSVGRKRRVVPAAIHRALWARDRGCRFPGCGRTRFVDAHHVEHWTHGGETSLGNLLLLCGTHHRLVHAGAVSYREGLSGPLVLPAAGPAGRSGVWLSA